MFQPLSKNFFHQQNIFTRSPRASNDASPCKAALNCGCRNWIRPGPPLNVLVMLSDGIRVTFKYDSHCGPTRAVAIELQKLFVFFKRPLVGARGIFPFVHGVSQAQIRRQSLNCIFWQRAAAFCAAQETGGFCSSFLNSQFAALFLTVCYSLYSKTNSF